MPSKFGGIPVESGSKFGGIPVEPLPLVGDGETPETLEQKFWSATADGDHETAQAVFHRMASEGLKPGKMPDYVRAAGQQRSVDEMSGASQFAAGAGGAFEQMGRGIHQAGLIASPLYLVNPMAQQEMAASKAAETAQRQQDVPLNTTGAGFTGKVAGNVAPFVAGGVAGAYLKSPAIVSAVLPDTIPGAMVQGGLLGAAQPLETGQNELARLGNVGLGAGFGGAASAGPRVIGAGINHARQLSPAFSRQMQEEQAARILLDHAHDPVAVRQALQQNQRIIPGTNPSTAEATRDVGLAGLNRTLANTPEYGNALATQNLANNAQRVRVVRQSFGNQTAGSEAVQRQAVQDAQGAAINEAKKQTGVESGKVVLSIDRALKSPRFINNPDVAQKMATVRGMIVTPLDDAARLRAARGVITDALDDGFRKSTANHDALLEARRLVFGAQARGESADETIKALKAISADGRTKTVLGDMARALRKTENGKPDVASLYNARKHITQTLMKNADAETMTALRGVVGNLDEQISKVAPTYKQYLTDYAGGMRKADQMAVGEELLGASSAIPDALGNPALSPAKFNRAGGNLDQTVRRASGFQRATADKALTGAQKQTVDAIQRDLARYSRSMTEGKAVGSNTLQNAVGGNKLQGAVGPVGAAIVEPISGVALLALNGMRKTYGEKTFAILQEAMLNPDRAAQLIAQLPAQQRGAAVKAVAAHIARVTGPAASNLAVRSE
jgi:hypothetical protein